MCSGKKAANVLVEKFASVSRVAIPRARQAEVKQQLSSLQSKPRADEEHLATGFAMAELQEGLDGLKLRKSPGKDGVTNEMLKNLGRGAKETLLKVINVSWKTGKTPAAWKEAIMVPILKPGKDKLDPASYRPISLLSCIGKLMERMVNRRLCWHLESKELLVSWQNGFRQHRSTEDQVAYIAQEIEDGYQAREHTLAVWVDMEKAFDTVWREALKLKLLRMGVTGRMFEWLAQYLENRTARVQVEGKLSRKRTLEQGVPQGGVLSPTLFLVFVNDIAPCMPKEIRKAMYAATWHCGRDINR